MGGPTLLPGSCEPRRRAPRWRSRREFFHPTQPPPPKKQEPHFLVFFFWMGGETFCPNFCYHFFFHTQITDHKGRGSFPWWFPELGTATYGRNMLEKVMELIQRFDVWGPGGCRNGEVVGFSRFFGHLSGCQCFVLYGGGTKGWKSKIINPLMNSGGVVAGELILLWYELLDETLNFLEQIIWDLGVCSETI